MDRKKEIIERAKLVSKRAHAPYSNIKIGAVALLKSGEMFDGCNVENCNYASSICAERVALFNVIASGHSGSDIESIAIACDSGDIVYPCGACRQVMAELMRPDAEVVIAKGSEYETYRVTDLLPHSFIIPKVKK